MRHRARVSLLPSILAGNAVHLVAAVLAVLLARRRAEHRPVLAFIAWTLAADLLRAALMVWGWGPARAALPPEAPLTGWGRVAHHLDQLLFLTWPAGLAAVSAVVFRPDQRRELLRGISLVYLAAVLALVLTYPANRPMLGRLYAVGYLAGSLSVIAGVVSWWPRRTHPRPEHAITIVLGLLDLGLLAGPFLPPDPDPFTGWPLAHIVYFVAWGAVCALQGGSLWGGLLLSSREDSS